MILIAHICSFWWSLRLWPVAPRRRATLYIDSALRQTATSEPGATTADLKTRPATT